MNTKIDNLKGHESKRITASNLSFMISQIATQSEVIVVSFTSVLSLPLLVPSRVYSLFQAGKEFVKKEKPHHLTREGMGSYRYACQP